MFTATQNSVLSLALTGAAVSIALPMAGSPNIAAINAQQVSDNLQSDSIYFATGAAPIGNLTAMNASLLVPGVGQIIAISGGQPAFLSAIGANGSYLTIVMGVQS